ncbi:MAG: DMT family transporter [Cyclonatronaceae bacterium]
MELWRSMLIGGLAHGMWLLCVLISLNDGVSPGIVALVVGLQPMTTGAFSGFATGERTSRLGWAGLLVGFIGVAISVGFRLESTDETSLFSYLVLLVSVGSITVASLMQRRIELYRPNLQLPVDASLFYQSLGTVLLVSIPAVFEESLAAEWNLSFNLTMIWLTVGVSIGAYAFMWMLLARIDATRVASLFYLGPPVTMLMDWVAFGNIPQTTDFVGLAVVFTGVFITYLPPPSKKKKM